MVRSASAWLSGISHLQKMVATPGAMDSAAGQASYQKFAVLLQQLLQQPVQPQAAWVELVQQHKVPGTLSRLCKQALLEMPESAALYAAVALLRVFLHTAAAAHVLERDTKKTLNMQRQIQESGLMKHLPTLFAAAAKQLTSVSGNVNPAAATAAVSSSRLFQLQVRTAFARDALAIQASLLEAWTPGPFSTILQTLSSTAAATPALVIASVRWASGSVQNMLQQKQKQKQQGKEQKQRSDLAATPDQTVQEEHNSASSVQQQQQQQQQLWDTYCDLMNVAVRCAAVLAEHMNQLIKHSPRLVYVVRPILMSTDWLCCLAVTIAWASSWEVRQAEQATTASSSSSGTSKNSKNSKAKKQSSQPQLQLTPSNTRLLQLLGISADALERIDNACRNAPGNGEAMTPLLLSYTCVTNYWLESVSELPPKQLLLLVEVDTLMPGFILRWAASLSVTASNFGVLCNCASMACNQVAEWPPVISIPAGFAIPLEGHQELYKIQQLLKQPPPSDVVCEIMPHLLKLTSSLLQKLNEPHMQAITRAAAAAAGPSTQPRSSSTAAATAAATAVAVAAGVTSAQQSCFVGGALHFLTTMLGTLLEKFTKQGTFTFTPGGDQAPDASYSFDSRPNGWAQMLGGLVSGLLVAAAASAQPAQSTPGAGSCSAGAAAAQQQNQEPTATAAAAAAAAEPALASISDLVPFRLQILSLLESCIRHAADGTTTGSRLYGQDGTVHAQANLARYRNTAATALQLMINTPTDYGHLHSLMCSTLKLSACSAGSGAAARHEAVTMVAAAAGDLLLAAVTASSAPHAAHSVTAAAAGAAAGGAEGPAAAPEAHTVASVLPSLVLLGRCFLQWGSVLQQELPALQQQQQAAGQPVMTLEDLIKGKGQLLWATTQAGKLSGVVEQWLGVKKCSAELSAAGYSVQGTLENLQGLQTAVETAQGSSGAGLQAALANLVRELYSTGRGLCSFAVPCFCNNPACSNLNGLSELQLVHSRRKSAVPAGPPATAARSVSGPTGSSTSQCARP